MLVCAYTRHVCNRLAVLGQERLIDRWRLVSPLLLVFFCSLVCAAFLPQAASPLRRDGYAGRGASLFCRLWPLYAARLQCICHESVCIVAMFATHRPATSTWSVVMAEWRERRLYSGKRPRLWRHTRLRLTSLPTCPRLLPPPLPDTCAIFRRFIPLSFPSVHVAGELVKALRCRYA